MNRFLTIFLVLFLVCSGVYAEGNEGEVHLDDGSSITYNTDDEGNTTLTITNSDGTASGTYYDTETNAYTEWTMDQDGNTYSKTTNADGSETGYTSIAGESFTDWSTDTEGSVISNTYNTADGSSYGYYIPGSGNDFTEWNVDSKGNTSTTTYNSVTGETNTYYDPARKSSSSPRKSSSSSRTSSSEPVYYPAVSSASGPAYISSNGAAVNVYSFPSSDGAVIARLENGTPVNVMSSVSGWAEIAFGNMTGHVDARFISFTAPMTSAVPIQASTAQYTSPVRTATEQYVTMIKIQPAAVTVRAPQTGGIVFLRWAPSEMEPVISNLPDGYPLTALSLNNEWVQVFDPKTNDAGFILRVCVNGL